MKDVEGKRRRVPSGDTIEGYFPAVVAPETFLKVQRIRKTRMIPAARIGARYSNLFSGIARCGVCGGVMHYENKGKPPKGGSYLVCSHARRSMGCARHAWRYPETQAHIISNLLELDFRELFPSLFERGREAIHKLESDLLVKEHELVTVDGKLERLTDLLLEREASPILLTRLDTLEQEKAYLTEAVEITQRELDRKLERMEGMQQEHTETNEALARFIKIEKEGDDEAKLETRRRLFHLLQKAVDKITFNPGKDTHGVILVHLAGIEDEPLPIVVEKGQKMSKGYSSKEDAIPDVTVVDAQWPPSGRILSMDAILRKMGRK